MKEKRRSDTQAGRDENDALARGIAWSFYRLKDDGAYPLGGLEPQDSGLDSGLDSGPPNDAQYVKSSMRHVHSLPCYESPVCLASS